jgi:hypothetical protein
VLYDFEFGLRIVAFMMKFSRVYQCCFCLTRLYLIPSFTILI